MAVGGALFGRTAQGSKALVEFRAGKMNLTGNTVTPDKRKGMVMVEQSEDHLMHFKWKDRATGKLEDDLIIFPDDIEFKRVPQCTTGRVFILKFKSSAQKRFFWMQEPKEDKDDEFCRKVNDYLNNPPGPGSSGRNTGGSSAGNALAAAAGIPGLDLSNFGDSELQSLFNSVSQQQLIQLLRGGSGNSALTSHLMQGSTGSSSTRQRSSIRSSSAASTASASQPAAPSAAKSTSSSGSTATTSAPKQGPIQLSDLQSILSGIQVPPGAGAGAGASSGSSEPNVDLSVGLTTDVLQPLLENPDFIRKMKELLPKSDDAGGDDSVSEIKGTIQSPQFKQALAMFSNGFQTGQLAPLIKEFNLGEQAISAAVAGDMEAFVKALQNRTTNDGDRSKEEEGMDLD